MAIEKSEAKTVKELNEALAVGESYVVECVAYCPEYPNIPKETWHVKREKTAMDRFRIVPWD